MMEPEVPEDSSLNPLSRARRIDSICDRFEADWNAGMRPTIEEFLKEHAGRRTTCPAPRTADPRPPLPSPCRGKLRSRRIT